MKKISIICIILSLTLIFLSCEKDIENSDNNVNMSQNNNLIENNSKDNIYLYGGQIFYDNGIKGWIDPEVVPDSIEYGRIIYLQKDMWGETVHNPITNLDLIICKDAGTICGKIVDRVEGKPDVVIGFYLGSIN